MFISRSYIGDALAGSQQCQASPVAGAEVHLPAVLLVHQLRRVIHMVQPHHMRQLVHDDGPNQSGSVWKGQSFSQIRRVELHLAGDVNMGLARNLN